ncbi:MAG: hypothetical protein ACRC8Y_07880 [Chroococcales cyanobacterium]
MINRRLALVSGLAILSAVTFAPKAGAAPTDEIVPFGVTITGTCAFSNTQGGTLAQLGVNNYWVAGGGGIPQIDEGISGKTTLNCTSGATLSVAVPVQLSAPAGFNTPDNISVVYDGTNFTRAGNPINSTSWDKPLTPLTIPAGIDVPLQVGMLAGDTSSGGSIPVGTYSYTVTLTATPN